MFAHWGWMAGIAVLLAAGIFLAIRLKEKNRLALFQVLTHLAIEDMTKPLPRPTLDAVQRRYNLIHETLEEATRIARGNEEKEKCEKLLRDLGDWRLQQIQQIYQEKLNRLLQQYHRTDDLNRKLTLLFEARELITEGILPETPLKKIDNLIVRLYVTKARLLAQNQPEEKVYEIFEEYITKVLNSGIEDKELDESKEFRQLVDDFEKLHRKYKRKRSKTE